MTQRIEIRDSVPSDFAGLEALCRAAFPEEDLVPLIEDLLREGQPVLSLVGEIDSQLVGHVVLTRCGEAGASDDESALLGPLLEPYAPRDRVALVRLMEPLFRAIRWRRPRT